MPAWPAALLLVVALGTIAFGAWRAPREAVPAWLAWVGLSSLLLLAAGRRIGRAERSSLLRFAVGGGLLLRLGALAVPLSLSDDAYRYLWDGRLVLHGFDPYALSPAEAVGLAPGLDLALLGRLNSPAYYSVYPPLAQALFAGAAGVDQGLSIDGTWVLRALFVAAEIGVVPLLLRLLEAAGRPRSWVLLYALHPLVVWEVAAGGHTEALMLPLLVLALAALRRERALRAGGLLAAAASAKLTALILGPVLLAAALRRGGPRRAAAFAVAVLGVLGVGFLPVLGPSLWPNVRSSLLLYSEVFSFNAPLYYAARARLGYVEGVTDPVDAELGPWLLAGTLLVVALGAALAALAPRTRLYAASAGVLLGYLGFARVVHPWYLLPVLLLSLLAGSRAVAALGLASMLTYLRYDPLGAEAGWVLCLEVGVLAGAVVAEVLAGVTASPSGVPRWGSATRARFFGRLPRGGRAAGGER